jgi:hypothetical protein
MQMVAGSIQSPIKSEKTKRRIQFVERYEEIFSATSRMIGANSIFIESPAIVAHRVI